MLQVTKLSLFLAACALDTAASRFVKPIWFWPWMSEMRDVMLEHAVSMLPSASLASVSEESTIGTGSLTALMMSETRACSVKSS